MKRMNPALLAASQEAKRIKLIKGAHKAGLILTLMVLGDQFDFTEEQLKLFMSRYRSELDSYKKRNVEVADFEQILREEYNIEVDIE